MIKDAYPVLTCSVLKETFRTDEQMTLNALTILKLLAGVEIYFAPGEIAHGMMLEGLGVAGGVVGYPGRLMRPMDLDRGLIMKLGGRSLTGFQWSAEEESSVEQQVNMMLGELGWTKLKVR